MADELLNEGAPHLDPTTRENPTRPEFSTKRSSFAHLLNSSNSPYDTLSQGDMQPFANFDAESGPDSVFAHFNDSPEASSSGLGHESSTTRGRGSSGSQTARDIVSPSYFRSSPPLQSSSTLGAPTGPRHHQQHPNTQMELDVGPSPAEGSVSPNVIPDSDDDAPPPRLTEGREREDLAAAEELMRLGETESDEMMVDESGVEREASEPRVDIMGGGEELVEEEPKKSVKSRAPRAPKASKAQVHAARVRGGKMRQAMFATTLITKSVVSPSPPVNSPGPSGLSHEIGASGTSDIDDGTMGGSEEMSREPTREGSPDFYGVVASGSRKREDDLAARRSAHQLIASTPLPDLDLSGPFAIYTPTGGNSSEEEGFKVQKKKGKGRVKEVEKDEVGEEEGDDRLYCVCRELYDPERVMIACDKCENWYHLECVKIVEEKVELVDQFICPVCESVTEWTTWKACCARPTCRQPVAPLSKYCSDYCGIEVAATRLEISGIDVEKFWPYVEGARRKESKLIDEKRPRPTSPSQPETLALLEADSARRQEEEDELTLKSLQSKLSNTVTRKQILDGNLNLVKARLRYLKVAIRRWEALCQATADGLASEGIDLAPSKSSKSKGSRGSNKKGVVSATSLPDAQCGLDVRLVYDNREWEAWLGGDEGRLVLGRESEDGEGVSETGLDIIAGVCLRARKKCERHVGWQKIIEASYAVELAALTRRLDRLMTQEQRLRSSIEEQQEVSRFRAAHRNRVSTNAISVDVYMEPMPVRTTPTKRSLGGTDTGGKKSSPPKQPQWSSGTASASQMNENYEIPDELLAFLSRSERLEQLRLRGKR